MSAPEKIVFIFGSSNDGIFNAIYNSTVKNRPDLHITIIDTVHEIYANGEIRFEIKKSIHDAKVYVFLTGDTNVTETIMDTNGRQKTFHYTPSDLLMQHFLAIDAARLADAREIIPVVPSYFYAPHDKINTSRSPVYAKFAADVYSNVFNKFVSKIVVPDIYNAQLYGIFNNEAYNAYPVTHSEIYPIEWRNHAEVEEPPRTVFVFGSSNISLFNDIYKVVKEKCPDMNISIAKTVRKILPSGEVSFQILENLKNATVYVFQTGANNVVETVTDPDGSITSYNYSCNDLLLQNWIAISECVNKNAREVIPIIPNYPYARQDKRDKSRSSISSKFVANIYNKIFNNIVKKIALMDLHAAQITGFFDATVYNIFAFKAISAYIESIIATTGIDRTKIRLFSPDVGGDKRTEAYSKLMNIPYITCLKTRDLSKSSFVEGVKVPISDPKELEDITIIAIDDMFDTCGTVEEFIKSVTKFNIKESWLACTHGVFSNPAMDILNSENFKKVTRIISTNTIDQNNNTARCDKLQVLDMSHLLGEVIVRLMTGGSIRELY